MDQLQSKVSLHCTANGRNAEYHAELKPVDGGFVVVVQYGAIGSSLQSTQKPAKPVEFVKAKKIMDGIIAEKIAKNYVPVGGAAPACQVGENQKERSGHLPQLLNSANDSELNFLLESPEWYMQEKKDGKRIALEISGSSVKGINKLGFYCSIPGEVVDAALKLGLKSAIIDGELIGQTFYAFDLVELNGDNLQDEPYIQRNIQLHELLIDQLGRSKTNMVIQIVEVENMDMPGEKQAAFERLKASKVEGVVFKKLTSVYRQGRPNSGGDQLKYKFTSTASVICKGANDGKRSISIALLDESGNEIDVGNVTIPVNHSVPQNGDVVEVRYLYYFKGGALFQPVYLGVRDDVRRDECVMSQLTCTLAPVSLSSYM